MNEFDIIAKYFRPLTNNDPLQDDAAILKIPSGYELVVTSDTLNAGTHFLETESPANIAHKALRVSLSDLAAMGADPLCYQLNLAFPLKPSEDWFAAFSKALMTDQKLFGIYCSGGDTTSIMGDYLSISITALGLVPIGKALRRGRAKEGDLIMLTGGVGDAYLGLKALYGALEYPKAIMRYRQPQPRLQSVKAREYIHAAADISDGFVADLTHVAQASGLGAEVYLSAFSFSDELKHAFEQGIMTPSQALIGGDDYELVMSIPPAAEDKIRALFPEALTVGRFAKNPGITIYDYDGRPIIFTSAGWAHF